MTTLLRQAIGALLLVAACGTGPGSATPPTAPGTAPATPGTGAASVAPTAGPDEAAAPPAGQAIQACSVLTDAEIERVAGYPVLDKQAGSVMGIFSNGCTWELGSEAEELVAWSIDLGVISPGGRDYFDTYLSFPDVTDPVPGLGDAAVTDGLGITAVKGDSLVSLHAIVFGEREDEITRELTEIALSRVP